MDVRMQEHPILGAMGLSKKVKFQYNGTELEGYEGEPIESRWRDGASLHTKGTSTPWYLLCNWSLYRLRNDCKRKAQCQNVCDTVGSRHAGRNTVRCIRRAIFQAAVSL